MHRRLSFLSMSLLRACNGNMAHIDEKQGLPGLLAYRTKREKTAQLHGLLKGAWNTRGSEAKGLTRGRRGRSVYYIVF